MWFGSKNLGCRQFFSLLFSNSQRWSVGLMVEICWESTGYVVQLESLPWNNLLHFLHSGWSSYWVNLLLLIVGIVLGIFFFNILEDRLTSASDSHQLSGTTINSSLSAAHSLLNQVNIIILPSVLLTTSAASQSSLQSNYITLNSTVVGVGGDSSSPVFVDILAQLKSKGVNLLGLRMLTISVKEAKEILKVLALGKDQQKVGVDWNSFKLGPY